MKQILSWVIKIGAFVIILEPVWMLLPFAGFLYGSVLNLEFLKNSYYTIWLLYFIFPVQTLMPIPLILSAAGLLVFLVGAFQIYSAKIRNSGLVTTGLYKKFRHPQYTGLVIFCAGILLGWGRFIAYIFFFLMLFVYYLLAKKEEKICLTSFGKAYEDYVKTTYFLFPGEKALFTPAKSLLSVIPQQPIRILVSFVLLMSIGTGVCFAVLSIRSRTQAIPFLTGKIDIQASFFHELPVVMIEGFLHHVKGVKKNSGGDFQKHILTSFVSSKKVKRALRGIDTEQINTLLCFLVSRTVREKESYYKEGKGDIFVMLLSSPTKLSKDSNFDDFRKSWEILGAMQVNKVDVLGITETADPVKGKIIVYEPLKGESYVNFQKRMEGILNIYLSGLSRKILDVSKIIEES